MIPLFPVKMSSPPTYFVVCLHERCSQEAAQFIADKLRNEAEWVTFIQFLIYPRTVFAKVNHESRDTPYSLQFRCRGPELWGMYSSEILSNQITYTRHLRSTLMDRHYPSLKCCLENPKAIFGFLSFFLRKQCTFFLVSYLLPLVRYANWETDIRHSWDLEKEKENMWCIPTPLSY